MRLPISSAADQARDAGVDVHHRAAGEVERALVEQEACVALAAAPASAVVYASGPAQNQTMCAIG